MALGRRGTAGRARGALAALALTLAPAPVLPPAAVAQAPPRTASEREIKAAYLYHFGKFVEWPADALARDAFTVCVLRDESFAGTFREQVGGKRIQDMPVVVRITRGSSDAEGCHVLYLGDTTEAPSHAPSHGTLVVADGTAQAGPALAFVLQGSHVRFVADVRAAEQAGLTLSSQLLKLAVGISGAPDQRGEGG